MTHPENKWSSGEQLDFEPRETRSIKQRVFRLIACGVPSCLGFAVIVWLLFRQGRLTVDPETGAFALRSQPIYLEEPGHELTGHRYLYDANLGWRNIGNWQATTRGKKLTINSKGLRDREYSYDKAPSVKRVLVLGDSFAWGYGVSDEEIFTEVLEAKLNQTSATWEVINTGVSGWGTDQEYLFLMEEGFRYSPDIVLLAFFLINDPDNNTHSVQYGLNKPVFLDESLILANVPVPTPFENADDITSESDPLSLTLAIIREISNECAARNAQLVVAKFGSNLKAESQGLREADEFMAGRISDHIPRILYLDLDAEFADRSISLEQLLEGNDDGHWNAFGHERAGEILFEFMTGQGVIGGETRPPERDDG